MNILEVVSIGDLFLTEEELITSRMIAQLYKTIKYQCIIVKRAQFCDKALIAAKAL